jgi:predicted nuclease of predicted toxin-antitoxin system
MRLFIDEDLSPVLAGECHRAGYDATTVRDRGLLAATDRQISELCFAEDRVLVTNNAQDFMVLAQESGIHPGLIFLPLGSRAEMCRSISLAVREIERLAADSGTTPAALMVNSVLDVGEDGSCPLFEYP